MIQLQLNLEKVSMWFLGDPKDVKVSLNFANSGPVDVDFLTLSDSEQIKILNDIQRNVLFCNMSFQDLYQVYLRGKTPTPEKTTISESMDTEVQIEVLPVPKDKPPSDKPIYIVDDEKIKKVFQKRTEKCKELVKQSFKQLKVSLEKEKDISILRDLRKIEEEKKKPRKAILSLIEEELKKRGLKNLEVIKTEESLKNKPSDPLSYDQVVIESDEEIVFFSADKV